MNQETWQDRKALLETYAKQLDLTLAESGALPLNHLVPSVEMGENKTWICPHCGKTQTTISILEIQSCVDSMTWEAPEGHFVGQWAPDHDSTGASELISYQCPDCNGFIYPVEEVSW